MERTLAICESEMIRNTFLSLSNLPYLQQGHKNLILFYKWVSCCEKKLTKKHSDFCQFLLSLVQMLWMLKTLIRSKDVMNLSNWSWHLPLAHIFFFSLLWKREKACVISLMVYLQFPLKASACRVFPKGQLFQYFILTGRGRIMCPTLSNVEPKLRANTSAPSHFSQCGLKRFHLLLDSLMSARV